MTMQAPTTPRPPRPVRGESQISGLDIAGFILAFLMPIIGLVLGIVGISEAHKQGRKASGLAVAAVVISAVMCLTVVIVVIVVATSSPDPWTVYENCVNSGVGNCQMPNN